jgi:hypothetical protein
MKMKNTSLLHKMKMTRKVIMVLVMMKAWNQWGEQSSRCMIQMGECLGS